MGATMVISLLLSGFLISFSWANSSLLQQEFNQRILVFVKEKDHFFREFDLGSVEIDRAILMEVVEDLVDEGGMSTQLVGEDVDVTFTKELSSRIRSLLQRYRSMDPLRGELRVQMLRVLVDAISRDVLMSRQLEHANQHIMRQIAEQVKLTRRAIVEREIGRTVVTEVERVLTEEKIRKLLPDDKVDRILSKGARSLSLEESKNVLFNEVFDMLIGHVRKSIDSSTPGISEFVTADDVRRAFVGSKQLGNVLEEVLSNREEVSGQVDQLLRNDPERFARMRENLEKGGTPSIGKTRRFREKNAFKGKGVIKNCLARLNRIFL